jgi:hypothetical protein
MSVIRNPNLGPSQARLRKRRLFFVRLYIILFFLLIIILGLAIFSGSEKMKVQTIIVSGNAAVSPDQVLAIANRNMTGRYGYLFAKSNSLIFPRYEIKKDLLQEIKTIIDLDINWDDWQQISINIVERKPHSVWCGSDSKKGDSTCYFVDKGGYIYGIAPVFSGNIFIKNYSNLLTDPIGQYFLPKSVYGQIFILIDLLKQRNMKVIYVSFDDTDYRFGLEDGFEIIFNDKNKFEISFQNLLLAIDGGSLDLDKDAQTIKYIDLRFDNRIVVGKK